MRYKGIELNCGYRIDILADNLVMVELKTPDRTVDIALEKISTFKIWGK